MTEILESVGAFFRANIWTPVSSMTWKDGLDILLLAVLFYFLYSFVSVRRAGKLLFGLATVVVLYVVTGWLDLRAALAAVRGGVLRRYRAGRDLSARDTGRAG